MIDTDNTTIDYMNNANELSLIMMLIMIISELADSSTVIFWLFATLRCAGPSGAH